jgi:hypothetical protein
MTLNNSRQENSSDSLLIGKLREWASLYGKTIKAEAIEAWLRIFRTTHPALLAMALEHVTKNAERMPTPGALTHAIALISEQHRGIGVVGERHCDCKDCGGTGFVIKTHPNGGDYQQAHKCKCHASHNTSSWEGIDVVDPEGTPCRLDPRTGSYLYRATDCEEGRQFLAKLAEVARKKDLSAWYAGGMRGARP